MHAHAQRDADAPGPCGWRDGCTTWGDPARTFAAFDRGPGPHDDATVTSSPAAARHRSMRDDEGDDHDVGRPQPPGAAALRIRRVDSRDRSSAAGQPRRWCGGRGHRRRSDGARHLGSLWGHAGRCGRGCCGGRGGQPGRGGRLQLRGRGSIRRRRATRVLVPELLPVRRRRPCELDASGSPGNGSVGRASPTRASFLRARAERSSFSAAFVRASATSAVLTGTGPAR
jgi:hypothetical protein